MDDVTVVAEELVPAVASGLPEGAERLLLTIMRGGYCAAASYCSAAKDRPLFRSSNAASFGP